MPDWWRRRFSSVWAGGDARVAQRFVAERREEAWLHGVSVAAGFYRENESRGGFWSETAAAYEALLTDRATIDDGLSAEGELAPESKSAPESGSAPESEAASEGESRANPLRRPARVGAARIERRPVLDEGTNIGTRGGGDRGASPRRVAGGGGAIGGAAGVPAGGGARERDAAAVALDRTPAAVASAMNWLREREDPCYSRVCHECRQEVNAVSMGFTGNWTLLGAALLLGLGGGSAGAATAATGGDCGDWRRLGRLRRPLRTARYRTGRRASSGPELVRTYCSGCHQEHAGSFERISAIRKTPEGWVMTLFRMRQVHGLALDEGVRESLVRYLSQAQGLAPSESAAGRFALERRPNAQDLDLGAEVGAMCGRCHFRWRGWRVAASRCG